MSNAEARVIVALDFPEVSTALAFVDELQPPLCKLKVGLELFVSAGPALVEELVNRGFDVFLDLKFHDIPNTVKAACRQAADLGVWMLNVHASGGRAMLEAAKEGVATAAHRPRLIAVTVLTSLATDDLKEVGTDLSAHDLALNLAQLSAEVGLDGIVCSAQEVAAIRSRVSDDFLFVTPGIRMSSDARGDQKRVLTPTEAIEAGASYLVVGRPVTRAEEPLRVLEKINCDILSLRRA